jgi:hypothetical protein
MPNENQYVSRRNDYAFISRRKINMINIIRKIGLVSALAAFTLCLAGGLWILTKTGLNHGNGAWSAAEAFVVTNEFRNPPRPPATPPQEGNNQKNPLLGGVRDAGGGSETVGKQPLQTIREINLPANSSLTTVSVMVSDTAGNWSPEQTLMVRLAKEGPRLKGAPVIYANDNGVVIAFETDSPCLASIEYGVDRKYGAILEQPKDVQRFWSSEDGGDWVKIRTTPRETNRFVLLKPAVASGKTCHYRLILKDEVGNQTVTDDFTFIVKGAAKSYFVAPKGTDKEGGGGRENPWRTPQFAVDRALPGDRIILLPGLYAGETKLTHGGLEGAPITIEPQQAGTVVLDVRHKADCCLRLEQAPYVVIKGLEMRWFNCAGVYAADSPGVTVEKSRFWFGFHGIRTVQLDMHGIFAHRSPGFVADHNVMYELAGGIYLLASPRSRVTYNTVCGTDYAGAYFPYSAEGTINRNNSFAYNGNDQYVIEVGNTNELAAFDSDYNNLGTKVRPNAEDTEDKSFVVKDKFFAHHGSKAVINVNGRRFGNLPQWQKASGKDLHSIFKDPLYSDAAHYDFRLQTNSPNIGAGEI